MSALAWGVGCAIAIACFAMALAWRRSHASRATLAERTSRPRALRDATLVYMEKQFRISNPVGLVAKLDRAYRMPSGMIVLVEFKTRRLDRPLLSDVVQLSAQRVAVMGQTGQTVASYAYVMIKTRSWQTLPIAHRVNLMSHEQIIALIRRREGILSGRVLPRGPLSRNTCLSCAFRPQCHNEIP